MKLIEKDREVEISDRNWPLAIDLFLKWGYPETLLTQPNTKGLKVFDIDKITCELSAWGIPWKRNKWSY